MLVANGVIAVDGHWESGHASPAFESLDTALAWCEQHFKKVRILRENAAEQLLLTIGAVLETLVSHVPSQPRVQDKMGRFMCNEKGSDNANVLQCKSHSTRL
jgi:hypothetical protein